MQMVPSEVSQQVLSMIGHIRENEALRKSCLMFAGVIGGYIAFLAMIEPEEEEKRNNKSSNRGTTTHVRVRNNVQKREAKWFHFFIPSSWIKPTQSEKTRGHLNPSRVKRTARKAVTPSGDHSNHVNILLDSLLFRGDNSFG